MEKFFRIYSLSVLSLGYFIIVSFILPVVGFALAVYFVYLAAGALVRAFGCLVSFVFEYLVLGGAIEEDWDF